MRKPEDQVKGNVEALEKLSASGVASIVQKEENIAEQEKALEEKLKTIREKKAEVKKEKVAIEDEFKKLPPFLATKIAELQAIDLQIKTLQGTRAEQAKNLKGDLVKAEVKEEFVNKVLGIRGFATAEKEKKDAKPKVTAEEKQAKIIESIEGGANTKSKIYNDTGMSQNTRDNLKALVDEGKVKIDGDGHYHMA